MTNTSIKDTVATEPLTQEEMLLIAHQANTKAAKTRTGLGNAPHLGIMRIPNTSTLPGANERNRRTITGTLADGRVSVLALCEFGPNQMRCERKFKNAEAAESARVAFMGYGLEAFKASGGMA